LGLSRAQVVGRGGVGQAREGGISIFAEKKVHPPPLTIALVYISQSIFFQTPQPLKTIRFTSLSGFESCFG
jgi:hypothetical protein